MDNIWILPAIFIVIGLMGMFIQSRMYKHKLNYDSIYKEKRIQQIMNEGKNLDADPVPECEYEETIFMY